MLLPSNFTYNQSNLQDFLECRRRFYLRYVMRLRWPAVQSEPFLENEKLLQQGTIFHRAAHQYFLGINQERIAEMFKEDPLRTWWREFLDFIRNPELQSPNTMIFPEHILSAGVAGRRIAAKYDLICFTPDQKVLIFDWKTSRSMPRHQWLADRMQTVIYPYLAALSMEGLLDNKPIDPEQIKIVYWFAAYPNDPQTFHYNLHEHSRAKNKLSDMIALIDRLLDVENERSFPLTENERKCAFCEYRSLCDRGIQAGSSTEFNLLEEQEEIEFDFDQITELFIG
jgi:CRISPR/Cas system-associated exonuclease Cas4 (RecB family)